MYNKQTLKPTNLLVQNSKNMDKECIKFFRKAEISFSTIVRF